MQATARQYFPLCQIFVFAKEHQCSLDLVKQTRELGRLPVVTFAAGGIATPADVAMMMQLGVCKFLNVSLAVPFF